MQYEFEEIRLLGEGVMASGVATLESAGEDYRGEFYVSEITFEGGLNVKRASLPQYYDTLAKLAFQVCAHHIENSRDAQMEWGEYEQELLCNG